MTDTKFKNLNDPSKGKNLLSLLNKIRRNTAEVKSISSGLALGSLNMNFNPENNFESFETLTANKTGSQNPGSDIFVGPYLKLVGYSIDYMGTFYSAKDSFLSEEFSEYISESEILKKFGEDFKKIYLPFLNEKRTEPYEDLILLSAKYQHYDKIEKAFFYLSEIFKSKSKKD